MAIANPFRSLAEIPGGTSDTANCQVAHERCNGIKGDKAHLTDLSELA
jgi:5-methylcytosine-specific restriction endonuclease McrA